LLGLLIAGLDARRLKQHVAAAVLVYFGLKVLTLRLLEQFEVTRYPSLLEPRRKRAIKPEEDIPSLVGISEGRLILCVLLLSKGFPSASK
tara:strand:+ start:732 stop:1001 length:270 start_codon:yes stop_codon:yes gene_type:complete